MVERRHVKDQSDRMEWEFRPEEIRTDIRRITDADVMTLDFLTKDDPGNVSRWEFVSNSESVSLGPSPAEQQDTRSSLSR